MTMNMHAIQSKGVDSSLLSECYIKVSFFLHWWTKDCSNDHFDLLLSCALSRSVRKVTEGPVCGGCEVDCEAAGAIIGAVGVA